MKRWLVILISLAAFTLVSFSYAKGQEMHPQKHQQYACGCSHGNCDDKSS